VRCRLLGLKGQENQKMTWGKGANWKKQQGGENCFFSVALLSMLTMIFDHSEPSK
jgi:hypothetical protein